MAFESFQLNALAARYDRGYPKAVKQNARRSLEHIRRYQDAAVLTLRLMPS